MKKRILALLLAGLLTASMTSCVSSGGKNDPDNTKSTSSTTASPSGDGTVQDQLQDVNETVYTVINASLLTDTNATSATAVLPALTELIRVKYSSTWSVVQYNGAQYYVASAALTADDIMGKGFTACEPTVMYTTAGLKVRPYASLNDSYSKEIATLSINTAVTVIGTGTVGGLDWSKIQYTDANETVHEYFVSSRYLSKTQGSSSDVDYSEFFDACTETTMYINVESTVFIRSTPVYPSEDNIQESLSKNTEVKVIATGKGEYSGWSQIKYPLKKQNPDDWQEWGYGYIKTSLLSVVQGGEAASLETLLQAYGFEQITPAKTMYVANNVTSHLNVRSTPDFAASGNTLGTVTTKQTVNVVGKGTYEGTFSYIITFENGYGFVSGKYITSDPDGAPMLDLDAILAQYQFTEMEAKTYYAIKSTNCYLSPADKNNQTPKGLTAGTQVTVVARGKYNGADLFILDFDGIYYFADASAFSDTASQG